MFLPKDLYTNYTAVAWQKTEKFKIVRGAAGNQNYPDQFLRRFHMFLVKTSQCSKPYKLLFYFPSTIFISFSVKPYNA